MRSSKSLSIVAAGLTVAALGVSGCGGDKTQSKPTNCTNKVVHEDATRVTVWAWYPNMAKVVDNFNNGHKDVQVCWTNVGQGGDEYNKFQTAVAAGKGAPDVVMLEADHLANYQIQGALVDISKYGANSVKKNFSAGAWKDVSVGKAVYAAPIDGGPMGMIYRKDIFAKYGITPPTTWAEYQEDAQKVKAAGGPLFGDLGSNVPAVMMALQIQKGATPFTYAPTKPKNVG